MDRKNATHISECVNRAKATGFPHFAQAMTDVAVKLESQPVFPQPRTLHEIPPRRKLEASQ